MKALFPHQLRCVNISLRQGLTMVLNDGSTVEREGNLYRHGDDQMVLEMAIMLVSNECNRARSFTMDDLTRLELMHMRVDGTLPIGDQNVRRVDQDHWSIENETLTLDQVMDEIKRMEEEWNKRMEAEGTK